MNFVAFMMTPDERSNICMKLAFYMDQARKYILDVYDKINKDDTFIRKCYNPFPNNPEDTYAWLCDYRNLVRLWVVSGIFFEHDKCIRAWLCTEIEHWGVGKTYRRIVWGEKLENIYELIEAIGSKFLKSKDYKILCAFRHIVNVHKHSHGPSYDALKKEYPEYLKISQSDSKIWDQSDEPGESIEFWLENDQIEEFFSSVLSFWKTIPEQVSLDELQSLQLPKWFCDAINDSVDDIIKNPPALPSNLNF